MKCVGYRLCDCPKHGEVCAKHFQEREGSDELRDYYECPGTPGDTGGCNEMLTSLGQDCERREWAEYPSEHV
jgi:hypothetical protein